MTYNGQHNYLQNWGEYSQIYDDNFQYVGYIENINPFFLDGNRVLFPGPTCAVIATLDDIVAVPQDENYTVTTPDIRLYNAPNPFNSSTTISFILPKTAHVNLTIYNIKGQKVVQLNDCKLKKGEYKLSWDSKDSNHKKVSSGLYFARLSTERTSSIRKIIIMK